MALLESPSYSLLIVFGILTYILSGIVYNLVFHPLAKIPGPWLPAITGWYQFYFDCVAGGGGQYPFKLKELHEKYGPIIRPVPGEVHISDPHYLDTIYAIRNRNHPPSRGLNVDESVAGAEDFHHHRKRREALNPYFSQQAVLNLQSLFTTKIGEVVMILEAAARSQEVLNFSDIYFAFSNDCVRTYSFGSDNHLLRDLRETNRQRNDLARLLRGIHFQEHFTYFLRFISWALPLISSAPMLPPAVMDLLKFKQTIRKDIEEVLATKSSGDKEPSSVFRALRDSSILPPEEKTVSRLQDEATLLIMAGTESTAKSLGIATFYLVWHPNVLAQLRTELKEARQAQASQDLSLAQLLALPYLNSIILETNRLSFGVTGRSNRYSPNETLIYTSSYGPNSGKSYALPPRTLMSTVTACTHTNESLFKDPWRFDPSRWIADPSTPDSSEAVAWRKRCMHALGKGHRRCLGMHVANAVLSLLLAEVAKWDLELVDTDERDVKFLYDFQVSHARLDTEGIRARVKGLKNE